MMLVNICPVCGFTLIVSFCGLELLDCSCTAGQQNRDNFRMLDIYIEEFKIHIRVPERKLLNA